MKAKGVYNSVGAGSGASRGTKRRVRFPYMPYVEQRKFFIDNALYAKRNENDTVCRTCTCFALIVWAIWPVFVHGQPLDTSGWRSAEYSLAQTYQQGRVLDMIYGPEWRQYSDKPIENDSLAQCGPNGCGVPQFRIPPQRPSIGLRPQNEPLAFATMVSIHGGLGVHVGNGIIVTCYHGDSSLVTFNGQDYPAMLLAGSPTNAADIKILRINATFANRIAICQQLPPVGTTVYWQNGSGTVTRYDNTTMFIRGRCRLGDSGSPIWVPAGLVGVLSAQRTDGVPEVIGGHCLVINQLLSQVGFSVSAPAAPFTQGDSAAGNASANAAGSNAEALILKMAESLEAIHAEVVAIKAREPSTATIKQEVSQAVTVQAAEFGRQLIDKELVPLRSRVDAMELQQQAFSLALKAIPPAQKGEKGDRGEKGEPGSVLDPADLTDAQIAALAMRLPPIHLRAKDPNTGLLSDEIRVKLGEGGIIVITKDTSPVSGGN